MEIELSFDENSSFFTAMYSNSDDMIDTYTPRECTPDKKETCDDTERQHNKYKYF